MMKYVLLFLFLVANLISSPNDNELLNNISTQQTSATGYLSTLSANVPGASIGFDAGGRTRVSQLTTLHDGKVTNGHSALLMATAGTGTFTAATDSKTGMSVTSGQYCIYYSKKFLTYLAGKSKLVEETFDNFHPQSNVTKRVGYFSSNAAAPYNSTLDGFYIESGSSTIKLYMYRAGTAIIDGLDITSWSGYANLGTYQTPANWQNFTVIAFDFLWLGGANFKVWIKVGDTFVLAHKYNHVGTTTNTMIKDPNQTIRYELRSTTGSGSFNYICSQVATEGSLDVTGCQRGVDSGTTAITCASIGTTYPIKAIRKQSAYRQIPVSVEDFGIFINSTNDLARYSISINPTLSAPLTYTNVANSSLQEATGNGTITISARNTVMAPGYTFQRLFMPVGLLKENFLSYLGSTIDNTMDEYVLSVTPLTASVDVFGYIVYKEY